MKTKSIPSLVSLFLLTASVEAVPPQLIWDPNGNGGITSGSGNWDNTAANKVWLNGALPDVAWSGIGTAPVDGAIFNGPDAAPGTYVVTIDGPQIIVTNSIGGLSLPVALAINNNGYVFTGATSTNTIYISSTNALSVAAGKTVTFNCNMAGSGTSPAWELGSGATMNVGGALTTAQQLRMGGAANSAFNLTGGGSIAIVYILAPVNVTAGTFSTTGNFFVGYPSLGYSTGTLTINNSGTVNENGGIFIMGRSTGSGTVVLQNGGTLNVGTSKSEPLDINYDGSAGASATVNVQGGNLTVGSSSFSSQVLFFATGSSGPGATATLNQSGGTISAWGGIVLGNSGTGSGATESLIQTGGTLDVGVNGISKPSAFTNSCNITLSGGTVGDLTSPGWACSLPITLGTANGNVSFSPANTITLTGALTDGGLGGGLNVTGGTLVLSGANNYSGSTMIGNGTLAVATAHSPVSSGAVTLDGTSGTPTLTATVTPGKSWATGPLTCQNPSGGTPTLNFQFGPLPPSSTAAPIQVAGNVNFATMPIVNIGGSQIAAGTYPLITYTGSIVNSGNEPSSVTFSPGASPTAASLMYNAGTKTIYLKVTASSVAPIYWGVKNGSWDTAAANWVSNSAPVKYSDPDAVIFDDSAPAGTPNIVTLNSTVAPVSVTANNDSAVSYIIAGTGSISGSGSLSLTGGGTLTLSNANTYNGGTTLSSGQLNINTGGTGSASPIGTGTLTINGGAIDNTSGADVTLQPSISENWNGDFSYIGSANNFNTGSGGISLNQNITIGVMAGNFTASGNISDGFQGLEITKTGNGALTLNGGNIYGGGLTLLAGTLNAGSPYFNGGGNVAINAPGGCILDNTSGGPLTVAQATYTWTTGFEFRGSASLDLGSGTITGNTDSTSPVIQVDTNTLSTEGMLNFGNVLIYKTGAGTLVLGGSTANSVSLDVEAGVVQMNKTLSQAVNGTRGLTVGAGGLVQDEQDHQIHSDTRGSPQTVTLQGGTWDLNGHLENVDIIAMNSGGTLENSAAASASITNISGYNDTLSGLCNFEIDQASGVLSICGVLAGDGTETLVKTGLGTLNLYSNNVYTGSTVISNGTLALPGAGSLANTAAIVLVSNNSVLDLSGNTVSTTLTLSGGQQLSGIGTVNGPLAALAGSTVAPGSASAIGTLTINGSASLSGITSMQINGSTLASDQLNAGANQITYGGALSVGNLGATPVQGNSFQLFSGGSYGGMFGRLSLPSLAPGLMWQMGQLPANGTINVVALKTPGIMQVGLAGGVLTLQGTNGLANEPYVVLGSTNISAPLAGWTPVYTNSFDGSGNFNISVSVTAAPHEFFTIETQ